MLAAPPAASVQIAALACVPVVHEADFFFLAIGGGEAVASGRWSVPEERARVGGRLDARPIVAWSAEDLRPVLRAHGHAGLPVWDVLDLFAVVFPEWRAPSLAQAAERLGLDTASQDGGEQGEEHQAALLGAVFAALVDEIARLEPKLLLQAERLAQGLAWPFRDLLLEVDRQRVRARLEGRAAAAVEVPGPESADVVEAPRTARRGRNRRRDPVAMDRGAVLGMLAPDGPLSRVVPGYEQRPEQVRMVSRVLRAMEEGGSLLLEAGTGTGKSLAYLLPAARAAQEHGWRTIVSTATTNLQDQLFQKDLPALQAALETPVRACVLKGRQNYLCLQRWQARLVADDQTPEERRLLLKTLFWVPRTRTGDRAELQLDRDEEEAWQRLCALSDYCTPLRCAYHRAGVCFLARARHAAEDAHIVIVNHALLLSDLASGSRVVTDHEVLVVDEAHQLEDEATSQLGWSLSGRELLARLDALVGGSSQARGGPGLLARARQIASDTAVAAPATSAEFLTALELGRCVTELFEQLAGLVEGMDGSDGATARLTHALRAGSAWQDVEATWHEGNQLLRNLVADASLALDALQSAGSGADEARDVAAALQEQMDFWNQVADRLGAAIHLPSQGWVYWLSAARRGGVFLSAAPLDVAETLSEGLFRRPRAVVLVSATLAVESSFAYVKERLGLPDASTLVLPSSFDFPSAAMVYLPTDVPEPTQAGFQQPFELLLLDLVSRLGGRTLVLFTSHAQLRATFGALRAPLASRGIRLLAQGVDGSSRTHLLETFRHTDRTVLFGTSSFWEGVDVVGDALSCVVLVRLPFGVPTDPIYAARAEQFEDPFGEYAVPQAVLRFKQGFGRLIRSRGDRGAVVVMDRRLVTRGYGRVFLRSLPDCAVKQGPAIAAGRAVADWVAPARASGSDTSPQPGLALV